MNQKQQKVLRRIIISAVATVALVLLPDVGMLPLGGVAKGVIYYLAIYIFIGHDILRKSWLGIRNGRVFDENFLMVIATMGAFMLALYEDSGDYLEAIAVMLFYQVGEFFQSYAVGKSRQNITELMDIRPDYARVEGEKVDPDDVEVGTIITVLTGEKVPIDGIVAEGTSHLNTAALTGESELRPVAVGDEVLSGSINMGGELKLRTTHEFEDSTVARIMELVEDSATHKSQSEEFIARFARYYTPVVCYAAVAIALIGVVVPGQMVETWVYRALIFLVISCPCALVVSIPLSFFAGIGGASRDGILIKGANILEAMSKVKSMVMDKTGTLTVGTEVKPTSAAAVSELRRQGISNIVMMSGDKREVAERVAAEVGITKVFSELLPADKVSRFVELMEQRSIAGEKGLVAFVGDGINDAPVLARADIGIAMGGIGTDAAIEAADIVLMDDDPLKISQAIRISQRTIGIVWQNIIMALGVKTACLLLGALGIANMWLAIFADVGVMVLAVLNAIRAMKR